MSLTTRLVLLIALAVLPAIGIQAYNEFDLTRARESDARDSLLQVARLQAAEIDRIAEAARQFLVALGQVPAIRERDATACNSLLQQIKPQYPSYSAFGVLDIEGNAVCSSVPGAGRVQAKGRAYFERAMQSGGFAVGDYVVGLLSQAPVLHFAHPFAGSDGGRAGVVQVSLNLDWLAMRLAEKLPPDSVLTITDGGGSILVRLPRNQEFRGRPIEAPFRPLLGALQEGTTEAHGFDGTTYIAGYVPPAASPLGLYVGVGRARDAVFADLQRASRRGIALIVLGLACALLAGCIGIHYAVNRPLGRVLGTLSRWRAGDQRARTGLGPGGSEIARLGHAFDGMAEALAEREHARAEAERALRDSQARLTFAQQAARIGTWDHDLASRENRWSPEQFRLFGMEPTADGACESRSFMQRIVEEDRAQIQAAIAAAAVGERPYAAEFRIVRPDEEVRWLMARGAILTDAAGRPTRMIGITMDITEQKRAEEALRNSEAQLKQALGAARMFAWDLDLATGTVKRSEAARDLLGIPEGSAEAFVEHIVADDRPAMLAARQRAIGGEGPYESEYRFRRPDGQLLWLYDRAELRVDSNGRPALLVGVCTDVTRRKTAERALQESEERLRATVDHAPIGIAEVDLDGRYVRLNDKFCAVIGMPRERLLATTFLDLTHPDDLARDLDDWERLKRGEIAWYTMEKRFRGGDGAFHWAFLTCSLVRDADGKPLYAVRVTEDISAQKALEAELRGLNDTLERRVRQRTRALETAVEELRRSRERYTVLFERSPAALFVVSVMPDGSFVYEEANPSWLRMVGLTAEDVTGRRPDEIFSPELAAILIDHYRACAASGERTEYEIDGELPAGRVVRRVALSPIVDPTLGRISKIFGATTDLTELRRLEDALRQMQKLEALGQLTGGVAHDFNNLLAAIIGNLELLEARLRSEGDLKLVRAAQRAGERGANLTAQLLAFSRKQRLNPEPTNLNELVRRMQEMMQRTIGPAVRIETVFAEDLWPALADRNQVEVALLNLAVNSRDAMPLGGTLLIETVNVPARGARRPSDLPKGDYVMVSVADTGCGMSEDVLAKAPEPFFTTKEPGKGTGLGLSQVYGVTRHLGGTLSISSRPGEGTTVHLYLPRARSAELPDADSEAARQREGTAAMPRGTVLLVDDDSAVRDVTAAFLREAGHAVIEAGSGRAAMEILDSNPAIDILVIDQAMPGMTGSEVAAAAREKQPGLAVLIVTGYANHPGIDGGAVLRKPFRQAELLAAVANLLPGPRDDKVVPLRPQR